MKKLFCTLLAAGVLLTYGMSLTAEAASVKVKAGETSVTVKTDEGVRAEKDDLQKASWWYDLWHDKKRHEPPPPPPHHRYDDRRDYHRPDHRPEHRPGDHRNDHRPGDHGGPRR